MTEYRLTDAVAEEKARHQQHLDEQLALSRTYESPSVRRQVAKEYLERSSMADANQRANAVLETFTPDESGAGLSDDSAEALAQWEAERPSIRPPPPRTAQDDALDELRQRHAENKARGIEDGWVDPGLAIKSGCRLARPL
jgi:hypothetical protein